jgi:2-hydroxychromene-2-carboxylate isomerase
MSLAFDLFWSFRSPYSYIVTPRVIELCERFDVSVTLRIVHPAAIRNPAYFTRMDARARPYFMLDSARVAAFHALTFRRPQPDPIEQDPTSLAIAAEQPLARRLSRLGVAAAARGRGLEFCWEIAKLLWDGNTNGWDRGDHLALATQRAGLDLSDLQAQIEAEPHYYEQQLQANDVLLRKAGHWGVPTMVFNSEPFFGQDRFDVLVWRMIQHGLHKRDPRITSTLRR